MEKEAAEKAAAEKAAAEAKKKAAAEKAKMDALVASLQTAMAAVTVATMPVLEQALLKAQSEGAPQDLLPRTSSGCVEGFWKSFIKSIFFRFCGLGESREAGGTQGNQQIIYVSFFPFSAQGAPSISSINPHVLAPVSL